MDYDKRGRFSGITDAPVKYALMATAGAHGADLRITNMGSVRDCRLKAGQKVRVRVNSDARPCSGFVRESMEAQQDYAPMSQRARKRAIREARALGIFPEHRS
jgi:hypothetical protein